MPAAINSYDYKTKAYVTETKYEGLVLAKKVDPSYQVMSDIWGTADKILVWENEAPKWIVLNVYDMNGPDWVPSTTEVDATDAIKIKYYDWLYENQLKIARADVTQIAKRVQKGTTVVKVVKGRDNVGSEGKVVVIMQKPYGMGYRANTEDKYGIALDDEMHQVAATNGRVYNNHKNMVWAWARNCEVQNVVVDEAEVEGRARDAVVKIMKENKVTF